MQRFRACHHRYGRRLRWVGTAGISAGSAIFFDNAVYMGHGRKLSRIDLDGAFTVAWRLQRSRDC